MPHISELIIIGERINPGFKSSKVLLDNRDLEGLKKLAISQVEKGAQYLTINVGDAAVNDLDFLVNLIETVQSVVNVPLAFDYPNKQVQELCLKTYDPAKAGGQKPIVNSVSELRWDMMDLLGQQPFKIVLMASERLEKGEPLPNHTPDEIYQTTRRMVKKIIDSDHDIPLDDLIVDVSVGPISTDVEGITKLAIESIRLIGQDPELQGIHMVVGLSNISIMLPKEAVDGSPLKVQLESSFLTLTMPLGLDMILGTPGRKYEFLPEDNFVFKGFREAIELTEYDTLMRVQELYQVS